MHWKRVAAALMAGSLTLVACGGSPADTQAVGDVKSACSTLLRLGSRLKSAGANNPAQGSDINSGLQLAENDAQSAAQLNSSRWSGFDNDVQQLATTLRSGKNADTTLLSRLSTTCQQYRST